MELMFANAWVLYLLWLVPLMLAALIAALRKRESRIAAFVAPVMQQRLRPKSDLARQTWQSVLLAAGLLLCMVALARPQWGRSEQRVFSKGRDVVIALDVSRSMLANDVHPNRLGRAKIDIMDLLTEIEGDRAALLAFRHKASALCPLTTDYAFLRHILDMAGLHSAPRGETDIGSAIDHAIQMLLEEDEGSHKAILLISDGEDLHGKAQEAARKAAARGIPIFTVGYGRATGSTIPDKTTGSSLKYKGKIVESKLNNETLYEIAKLTGGAYVPIQTASTAQTTLGSIYRDHFSRIAARELEESITFGYSERFHYFLLPGVLLLIAAAFLSKGRLAGGSRKSIVLKDINPANGNIRPLAVIALFLLPALCLGAADETDKADADLPAGRAAARAAQRLYEKGKLEEASELYLRAARTITGPASESFTYNAAVSLFDAGKHEEAIDLLNTISGEGAIPRDKLDMALGTAHYQASRNSSETNELKRLQAVAEDLRHSAEYFAKAARLKTDVRDEAMGNAGKLLQEAFEAKSQADTAELMAEHADSDAFAMLDKMLTSQRAIMNEAAEAYTTDDPSQVALLEALSERQKKNADLWLPLKEKLGQAAKASTNQVSSEALEKMANEIQTHMRDSSDFMRDLDSSGYHKSALSEDGIYRMWKGAAPYSSLLSEDLRRQSNAISESESPQLRDIHQEEGVELTKLFRRRFEEAFPKDAPPPQQDEDKENAMTPEKRAQVLDLTDLTIKTQEKASEYLKDGKLEEALERQIAADANLREIQSLLPKQSQQDQEEEQQDQQQNQQDQEQQDNEQEPADDPQKDPDQQEQADPSDEQNETEPEEQPADPKQEEEMSESDVQRLLEKALQREKQHEIEKRKKSEFIPPKMIDRDW